MSGEEREEREKEMSNSLSLSYLRFAPDEYETQLQAKITQALILLSDQGMRVEESQMEIFRSPLTHYRHRCRFGIKYDDSDLWYVMWENGEPSVRISSYPLASIQINAAMDPLLQLIKHSDRLKIDIKAVHFLSTTRGELSITLIYQKPLCESWRTSASELYEGLKGILDVFGCRLVGIRGRSKGTKYVIGEENVMESFSLASGRQLLYQQIPDGFSNPNPEVNVQALNWISKIVGGLSSQFTEQGLAFLELFCGNGNHTMALSEFAKHIVAVELNRLLCEAADCNLSLNGISNVTIVPCDSEKFARRILKNRSYISRDGVMFHFGGVLVDPPRAGLDSSTRKLVVGYDNIIYISCNPEALSRDIAEFRVSHEIKQFAIFDQFAYTTHLECGVYLRKR